VENDVIMNKRMFLQATLLALATSIGFVPAQAALPITEQDVLKAQSDWGKGIVEIGRVYQNGGDYKAVASRQIDILYGYNEGRVMFKPTKAARDQFRETKDEAISYFVGGSNSEDHGFAIQPWSKVRFENDAIVINQDSAESMGNYYFTDAKTGKEVKAECTFGYKRSPDDRLVIFLHHSSFPYQPH
jgi:hypothetical protein